MLGKCLSKHIVRQYRRCAQIKVPGEAKDILQIALYLQYCPGGDLKLLLDQAASTPEVEKKLLIMEEDLWDMFYCLSLAVSVMARRTEDTLRAIEDLHPLGASRCTAPVLSPPLFTFSLS